MREAPDPTFKCDFVELDDEFRSMELEGKLSDILGDKRWNVIELVVVMIHISRKLRCIVCQMVLWWQTNRASFLLSPVLIQK